MPHAPRGRITPRVAVIVSAAIIAYFGFRAFQPPISITKLDTLKPGMTQTQVRAIIGEPTEVQDGGRAYEVRGVRYVLKDEWSYKRALTFGYVNISFDDNRLFTDYNYESF